ncbi:hypothetical protein, partial [Arsenicibacter rosenii]|uniref:hypothetical protein n=1 Tax=Arsenicibacter rosenii TaxID=1750698 RepID=UPI0015A62F53
EFLSIYDGSPEQQAQLATYQTRVSAYKDALNQSDAILPATRTDYVSTLTNTQTTLQCPLSQTAGGQNKQAAATGRLAAGGSCNAESLIQEVTQQQNMLKRYAWVAEVETVSSDSSFLECIASIDYHELTHVSSGPKSITIIITRNGKQIAQETATIQGRFYRLLRNDVEYYYAEKESFCDGRTVVLIHMHGTDNTKYDGMYYYYDFDLKKYKPFLPKNYPKSNVAQMIQRMSPGLIKFADVTQAVMTNTALLLATGGLGAGGIISRVVGTLDFFVDNYSDIQAITNPGDQTAVSTASVALFLVQLIDIDRLLKHPEALPEETKALINKAKQLDESGEIADKLEEALKWVQEHYDEGNPIRKHVEEVYERVTGRILKISEELKLALVTYRSRQIAPGGTDYQRLIKGIMSSPHSYYFAESIIKYTKLAVGNPERIEGLGKVILKMKQLGTKKTTEVEGELLQMFHEADALLAKGKSVFFEVEKRFELEKGLQKDLDLMIESAPGIIEEGIHLKALSTSNLDKITSEIVSALNKFPTQVSIPKKTIKIWLREISEEDSVSILRILREKYAGNVVKIYVRIKDGIDNSIN